MGQLLNADVSDAQMRNVENRLTALEQKKGANGVINPNARPQVKDGADLFLTFDLLLWQAHENGLGYAIKNEGVDTTPTEGRVKHPDFDWNWGFRTGLGYNLPHDGWDLFANYTRLNSTADQRSTNADSDDILFGTVNAPSVARAFGTATKAKNHWHCDLNMIDLEMGREFYVSKWLSLRPFAGFRTAWVDQEFNVDYQGGTLAVTGQTYDIDQKNKYWGFGLRTGINALWTLGSGVSFYSDAAISLLHGFFKVKYEAELEHVNEKTLNDVKDSYHVSRAITDLAIGLQYDHMFFNDAFHLGIRAGWEHHMFFGQNQFLHFVDDQASGVFVANQGDLTYQGWTLNVRFDF